MKLHGSSCASRSFFADCLCSSLNYSRALCHTLPCTPSFGSFRPPDDLVHNLACAEEGASAANTVSVVPRSFRPIDEFQGQLVIYTPEKMTGRRAFYDDDIALGFITTVPLSSFSSKQN